MRIEIFYTVDIENDDGNMDDFFSLFHSDEEEEGVNADSNKQ